jgi:hypothetical protein
MADAITATATPSTFKAHDEGQFVAQCVDVINLGEKVQDFPGTKFYLAPTCALVFRTGEVNPDTGEFIDLSREFTVSMGDKANLRKFLQQWRGKDYTPEQVEAGVPLDKLTGQHALLTVGHRVSGKGKTYANITACVGIPKQMAGTVTGYLDGYTRAEFWELRKKEYAEAAAKFRAEQSKAAPKAKDDDFTDFPGALADTDDDLPF